MKGFGAVLIVFTVILTKDSVSAQNEENEDNNYSTPPADVPYPNYTEVPKGLAFDCKDKIPGYYADPQTGCQVWHWCVPSGQKYSFICPAGTVFNQAVRVCDWFYNVKCEEAPSLYNINNDLYKDKEGNYIQGK